MGTIINREIRLASRPAARRQHRTSQWLSSSLFLVVVKRLTMGGFLVFDWLDKEAAFQQEVGGVLLAGN